MMDNFTPRAQQLSPQVEQRVQSLEWTDLPGILARIHAPEFPPRNFDVMTYGAKGDGVTDSLPAIRTAMEKCQSTGGGHVVVPAGTYLLNGPVVLAFPSCSVDEEFKRQAVELVIHSGKRNLTFNLLCLICYGFKRDIAILTTLVLLGSAGNNPSAG